MCACACARARLKEGGAREAAEVGRVVVAQDLLKREIGPLNLRTFKLYIYILNRVSS